MALRSIGRERADLLLVFATTPHGPGFTRVTRTAAEVCGTHDVIGCSAAGVLAGEREVEGGPGVALLALAGDVSVRRFFVPIARGHGGAAAHDIARAVGDVDGGADPMLLLFADTYNLDAEGLFAGLAERLPGVRVVGGGASEDGSVGEVSVFAGDTSSSGAIAGALVQGDIRCTIGVSQAVRRVGPVFRVTGADRNWILALDGTPAVDVFRTVVPQSLLADPRRALAVVLVGLATDSGDFVARHLVALDGERGALAVGVPLDEGQELFFGVRDPLGAREDLQRMLAEQAAAWRGHPAAGALYVDCVGRGSGFYGVPGLDAAYIQQHFGSIPVAGFFSGAEFAPGPGASRVHQYTGVLTVLGRG